MNEWANSIDKKDYDAKMNGRVIIHADMYEASN